MENVQKRAAPAVPDFLAIILIGMGSSYARGPDKDDCVKRVARIVADDWSHLFDVGEKPAIANVYQLPEGADDVYWDHRGVFYEVDGKEVKVEGVEYFDVVIPKVRKRR